MTTCVCLLISGCTNAPADEAELKFGAALQKNPADLEARLGLSRVLAEKDACEQAVAVIRRGPKDDPNNASLFEALAKVFLSWREEEVEDPHAFEAAKDSLKKQVDSGTGGAEALKVLGYVEKRLEQYQLSLDSFTMAFRLDPEDTFNQGRVGYAYTICGKYEKGLPLIRDAAERKPDHYLLWWWLGDTQRALGQYEDALDSFARTSPLCPRWERATLSEVIWFTRWLAAKEKSMSAFLAHREFGERHESDLRLDRAIAEYELALQVLPAERHYDAGWCNTRVAECYRDVGKLEVAIEHALRGVEAHKKYGDAEGLTYAYQYVSTTYGDLAWRHKDRKTEFLEKAISAAEMEAHYAAQVSATSAWADDALVRLCMDTAEAYGVRDPRVKKYRDKVVERLPGGAAVKDPSAAAFVQCEARMQLLEENYAKARELYEMALTYYEESKHAGIMITVPFVYNSLINACWKTGDIDAALEYAEKSIEKLSTLRSALGEDQLKRAIGGAARNWLFSSALLPIIIQRNQYERAFDYGERYKCRSLLDLLGSKTAASKLRMVERKRVSKGMTLGHLRKIEQQIEEVRSSARPEDVGSLERTLSIEKANYERLAEDVSAAEHELRSFETVDALNVEQLRPLADGLTIVSYTVGEWGACATILSRDDIQGVTMQGVSEENLRVVIEAFRREMGLKATLARDLTIEVEGKKTELPEEVKKGASELLYKALIEPVLPYIKTKLIIISPDSVLNYLPFEALQKNGRYLIEDYAIAYAPSASVLKICMDRNRNRREKVLAFGNPNLKNPAFRLVHAEDEVNSLKGLFPQVDVYTGDNATERVLQEHGSEYDILHFACHGELNLDEPMLTSLRLAPDDENDGYLHAGEVFDYDLSASLVVLSACNSALGELTSGNELMGLTRSFLYAGVPSIVASLWTVDDRSTAYLMQQFYRNLGTMTKADALREAKLATMKKYPSPFHWAAFCLQGDYR